MVTALNRWKASRMQSVTRSRGSYLKVWRSLSLQVWGCSSPWTQVMPVELNYQRTSRLSSGKFIAYACMHAFKYSTEIGKIVIRQPWFYKISTVMWLYNPYLLWKFAYFLPFATDSGIDCQLNLKRCTLCPLVLAFLKIIFLYIHTCIFIYTYTCTRTCTYSQLHLEWTRL